MYRYYLLEFTAWILAFGTIIFLIVRSKPWRKLTRAWIFGFILLVMALFLGFYARYPYPLHFALPPMTHSMAPGGLPSSIPFLNLLKLAINPDRFETVEHIGADPNVVSLPPNKKESATVRFELVAQEVYAAVSPGIYFNFWTYNKQVPGPMMKVKEGDTVEIVLTNHPSSLHPHNIDLHSVTGPGGGAVLTNVQPGEKKAFRWKALNPGLYVYHCATPNVSTHNSHGQYGLILVEPKEGLPPVDREFYVMQGELYTDGDIGKKGLVAFDSEALLDGIPNYVTFNGIVEQKPRMKIKAGDRVRIYVGNGGVNLISSFHVIGEIFDFVYPEGAIGSEPFRNVQTTAVLPGGATIVEFTAEVPGKLVLVDHALARLNKGAWAIMEVEGENRPDIFSAN